MYTKISIFRVRKWASNIPDDPIYIRDRKLKYEIIDLNLARWWGSRA